MSASTAVAGAGRGAAAGRGGTLPTDLGAGPFAVGTSGLVKRYGSITALDGLGLQVPEGAVYVLVGPNGAGKSTLLKVLAGLAPQAGGTVNVLGTDPRIAGGSLRARIGYVPEGHDFGYRWMRIGRLLEQHALYFPTWDHAYAARLADAYEIDPERRCGQLSKGQSRRVQMLVALAHRPSLLLLDEPTDGLDHVIRDRTLRLLAEHLEDNPTTALISTHRVYEVERLVDHVGVISDGRLVTQVPRPDMERRLRRYWADVPEGWNGVVPELNGHVIRRSGHGREIEWTVWGEQERVTAELARAGATVREVARLSLDDAATTLLSR